PSTGSWEPAAAETGTLQAANDVRVGFHHVPDESAAVVLDHDQDGALVDAEIVDVEPAERGVDGAGLLLALRGEGRIEGVDEAVGLVQLVAVDLAHLQQRRNR